MRTRILAAAAAVVLSTVAAGAEGIRLSGLKTTSIVESCRSQRSVREANYCAGFVIGIADYMSLIGSLCVTPGWSAEHAVAVARKALEDDPAQRDNHPVVLVSAALLKAWPCRR